MTTFDDESAHSWGSFSHVLRILRIVAAGSANGKRRQRTAFVGLSAAALLLDWTYAIRSRCWPSSLLRAAR
jgi:hypothetical protein